MPEIAVRTTNNSSGGGVSSQHPLFGKMLPKWVKIRDCYEGEDEVKGKGQLYLPPTSGMVEDGMANATSPGRVAYDAYKMRAVLPDIVNDAVDAMLGVMHHKPPVIELPAKMESLMERATLRNESLPMLLRRINEEQLITGRCGLLADMPANPTPTNNAVRASSKTMADLPYIALYPAESIINWDSGRRDGIEIENLNLVVLNESEYERDEDFSWNFVNKYRTLVLGEADVNEPRGDGIYRVGVFRDEGSMTFNPEALTVPQWRGRTMGEVPFTFINSCDIVPDPDKPPLLGLANLVLTIYRGEGDYRQNLFMQGQDTLVLAGGNSQDVDLRVGSGGRIDLPQGGTAQYIGVSGEGLEEQRIALENDYIRAGTKGGQLMDSVSRERESGDALKIRVAARTATLNQIALTGAFGLQYNLRQIAAWVGANPEEVTVTPNLDFIDDSFQPDDLVKFITAKNSGAPISYETIHKWLQNKDITELDFEEEIRKIDEEDSNLSLGTSNPEDLEEDDDDRE